MKDEMHRERVVSSLRIGELGKVEELLPYLLSNNYQKPHVLYNLNQWKTRGEKC